MHVFVHVCASTFAATFNHVCRVSPMMGDRQERMMTETGFIIAAQWSLY